MGILTLLKGDWLCFEDTFIEGDIESLPELEPSSANETTDSTFNNATIQQPIRGFGKIWRESDQIQENLGWALDSEVEHSARREYIAGGYLDENNNHVSEAGEWRLHAFYGETITCLKQN